MFAHQVIEYLRKHKIVENNQRIIDDIIQSHKFHIENIHIISNAFKNNIGRQLFLDMEYIKLPYSKIWLDFTANMSDVDNITLSKIGMLAILQNKDKHEYRFVVYVFDYFKDNHGWAMIPAYYVIDRKKTKSHGIYYKCIIPGTQLCEESKQLLMGAIGSDVVNIALEILENFLLLINCKNVTTESHKPEDALNKARRKRGRQELFTYKTLKLILPAEKQGKHYKREPTGEHNRIHFCRGHFKEYTADAPLFGKIIGLWWWQPHVRGRSRDGIVIKDYEINGNQSSEHE